MSLQKSTRIKLGISAVCVAIFSVIIASFSLPAFAKDDTIAQKAALYGVYNTCYKGNNMVTSVRADEYRDIWSIAKGSGTFNLPTEWYSEYSVNCAQLIQNTAANASFAGIANINGVAIPSGGSGTDTINTFLENMGYTKSTSGKGQCATFTYAHDNGGDPNTITLCAPTTDKGVITSDKLTVSYSDDVGAIVQFELDTPGEVDLDCNTLLAGSHGGCTSHHFKVHEDEFSKLVGLIYADLQEHRSKALCIGSSCWRLQPGVQDSKRGDVKASFKIENSTTAGDKAVKFLSKGTYKNHNELKLSAKERADLLQDYLQNYYRINIYGCNLQGNDASVAESGGYSKVRTSLKSTTGGFQECWVKPTQNNGNPVAGYRIGVNFFDGTMMDFPTVIRALNTAALHQDKDDTIVDPSEGGTVGPSEGEEGEEESNACYDAASPLGWVICPALSIVGDATAGMYDYLADQFLNLDSSYMRSRDEHGTWKAWDNFRNLSNVAFAIALLVIILSQITGFGVSNYGIKKMLPSLIIVAIMSNLSFFLCQVAVDLSNIVGYDVRRLLIDIAPKPGGEFGDGSLGAIIGNAFGALTIGTATGALGIFAAINWRTWIWPLLLVILSAVIGVFFFFLLLGARQAGIIILVALAPVAIICYALPNTKSIFNRWWKMFSALLLVYPICGALMGGGEFASRLMLANVNAESGFMFVLVAMLLQSITFFFVPTVVRSAFQAIGNIGAKISSFGRGISKTATGSIRKSDAYKDRVQRGRAIDRANSARRAMKRQAWRDDHGLSIRERASRWAGRDGWRGKIGNAAESSRNWSQARRINSIAGQRSAERQTQITASTGLLAAERRERDALMKNYESGYRGDDEFMNDFAAQSRAYEAAIDAVDQNPGDMKALADLRSLQNILGNSADGQDIIQNVLHRRLADAQSRGITTVSDGLRAAGRTLINDHGGFKSGNRGLNKLALDLGRGEALESDRGEYLATKLKNSKGQYLTDKAGNRIYENNNYGSAAAQGSAAELAAANDSTLDGLLSSVQNGNMSVSNMEAVYRNAGEAITNKNIPVKTPVEERLNDIRKAVYDKLHGQQVDGYTDNTGREFTHAGGNNYQYTDGSGNVHNYTMSGGGNLNEVGGTDVVSGSNLTSMSQNYYDDQGRKFVSNGAGTYTYDDGSTKHTYTRNAATGDFTEFGTGSEVITGNRMKTAADNFGFNYGNGYRDLHAGDTFKVGHEAPKTPTKKPLPTGWTLDPGTGGWIDITTGRPLTPMEARKADSIVQHNNEIDNNS